MILQINPQSLIKLSAGAFILIFQMEKLFMADHVGWKLSCDLFQNIRQCNIIKNDGSRRLDFCGSLSEWK